MRKAFASYRLRSFTIEKQDEHRMTGGLETCVSAWRSNQSCVPRMVRCNFVHFTGFGVTAGRSFLFTPRPRPRCFAFDLLCVRAAASESDESGSDTRLRFLPDFLRAAVGTAGVSAMTKSTSASSSRDGTTAEGVVFLIMSSVRLRSYPYSGVR